jgi:hypothetical protein
VDSETLSQLANVPRATLRGWLHNNVLPRPERPNCWNVGEVLAVMLLVAGLRAGLTIERARAQISWRAATLSEMARQMVQAGRMSAAARVIFVEAEFGAGREPWLRLITTVDDLTRLTAAALRRHPRRLAIDDFTDEYVAVLLAFDAVRAARPAERAEVTA